jgi:hypothetical protein
MSGSRNRSLLVLAGVLLAVVVASLWWIASPAGEAHPASRSPREAESASAPAVLENEPISAKRLDDRPREPVPTVETPVSAATEIPRIPGVIEGRVLRRDGSPAAPGTLVIAREPDNLDEDLDRTQGPSATTDAGGRFVLEGLTAGASYSLSAVGNGTISTQPAPPVSEGTSGVRIDVSLLYGIAVDLREAGGTPLHTMHGFSDQALRTSSGTLFPDRPLLGLVGVDLSPYRSAPGRRLFLYTSSTATEPASLERVPLKFRLVGYAPAEVAFDALPIVPAIPQHVVELQSTASGWSEIDVVFEDARDPTTNGPRIKPFRLLLSSSSGPQAGIELPRDLGPKRLLGIPFARYRVSLLNALDQQVFPTVGSPPPSFDVGARPATLSIPLAATSELEIQVRGREDRRYEGRASFSLARGGLTSDGRSLVGATVSVTFDRAPYVLGALLPGHYALFVQEPAGAVVEPASSNGLFDLEAGIAKTVTLSLN